MGQYALRSLTWEKWTRAIVRFSDLEGPAGQRIKAGDRLINLVIQTGVNDGQHLRVDNIEVVVPGTRAARRNVTE